jgi:hypothetical protein
MPRDLMTEARLHREQQMRSIDAIMEQAREMATGHRFFPIETIKRVLYKSHPPHLVTEALVRLGWIERD